jgi:serine/threonine protein kinase
VTLTAGSRLGPYEIVSALGAGGMGEVYRAKDPRLGRGVAVKVLPASFSTDADRLRRFEREVHSGCVMIPLWNHKELPMATVTVKDLPEKLHRQLKARALRHRRSLNSEIIEVLEAATTSQKVDPDSLLARAAALRSRVGGRLTDTDLAALRQAGRR